MVGRPAPRSVQARTAVAGLVPQDPAIALYHESVAEEVAESARNRRVNPPTLEDWRLAHLARSNPRDISVGQQQRVALASMLSHRPRVWLLDEPTRGADGEAKRWLADRLRAHAADGGAAIVATHDIESAARFATRVIALDQGEIVHDLPAREAFAGDGPFPTQVARLVPGALIPEEVDRE
jgi:energy-coupling factor transport system ATP-binding protein